MKIDFHKYHGTGNDFILVHNPGNEKLFHREAIQKLCDRHLGIGADGLMYLLPSDDTDFKMQYFNADGLEGSLCGNGARCIVAFAFEKGVISENTTFTATDGIHRASVKRTKPELFHVSVSIPDVVEVKKLSKTTGYVDTGSPHYIEFVDDIESIDVYQQGKKLRWDKRFQPHGTNVNFIQKKGNSLIVKTFERGVENVTLSCGTGVTAAAIAADLFTGSPSKKWNIRTSGGELFVSFENKGHRFTNITLEGPAEKVFEGTIEI